MSLISTVNMASDEDSRNMAIKVIAGLFMSIATVAVILRCYVRGFLVKAFGWDDGAMLMAMVNCCPSVNFGMCGILTIN